MSSRVSFRNKESSLIGPMDQDRKIGLIFLFISIAAHGLFFAGLIFSQDFRLHRSMPPAIQVDLVSFAPILGTDDPAGGKEEVSEPSEEPVEAITETTQDIIAGMPVTPAEIQEERVMPPVIKPDISLKTKPKDLKDLLAEQEKKEKEAEKKQEEKIEKPKPQPDSEKKPVVSQKKEDQNKGRNQIAEALSRMQKTVMEQKESKQVGGGVGGGEGGSSGTGKKGYKPLDLYNLVIASAIKQNWVFSESLARMDKNLEVRILIKILRSGEIRDIIYETRSGNPYLDESAKRAILKSNPLPPLPLGMSSYDLGLIFTPEGLR